MFRNTSVVYLLHFDRPISPSSTTQHYIGSSRYFEARIRKHKLNPDARLLQVAKERGIGFTVARIWTGGRKEERRLKNLHNGKKLCPICSGKKDQLKEEVNFY